MAASRIGRALIVGGPHLVAIAPAAVALTWSWARIQERMASRFAPSGTAVDHLPRPVLLVVMIVLGAGLAAVFGLAYAGAPGSSVSSRDTARLFAVLSWAAAGFVGTVLLAAVLANVGAGDLAVVALPAGTILDALGVAVVTGGIGALTAPRSPARSVDIPPPAPAVGRTEQVSWTRSATAPWLSLLGAGLMLVGLVVGTAFAWQVGAVLLVAGVVIALSGGARVTMDRRGLTVAAGLLGWPRVRVPLEDVVSSVAEDVSPARFGGWGYRVVPGGSGVILRSGPALVVTRHSGRRFTVTVDDAATAAGLLNGLVAQRA